MNHQRAEPKADYNLRVLWPLARYVEERRGAGGLRDLARGVGLEAADLDGRNRWVDAATFEALIAAARATMESDDEFKRACAHRFSEAYGPLRYVLWATSPGAVFAQAAKHFHLVSTCGEMTVEATESSARGRFRSRVPFSRLNCILRQAQASAMPTLWGLPRAHLRERACVAWGDEACEFDVHWYTARRWLPILAMAAVFAAAGALLVRAGVATIPAPFATALFGGVLGYLREVRRAERANAGTRAEVMKALEDLAGEEADARREALEMHRRQRDWTRLVEEEMTARSAALQSVLDAMQQRHVASALTLLGVSHDMSSPLTELVLNIETFGGLKPEQARSALAEMKQSAARVTQIAELLREMLKNQQDLVPLSPERVVTRGLAESLKRRLRTLCFGRDVRVTVMATREVPESLVIDPLVLDRILDNLLSNAAKYTERGSILVDLEGKPGFLVVKVSDTGRGIAPEALERAFEPGGSDPATRKGSGLGVGLSVVVQLLAQIGGHLEVMSKPGLGTTFWVELPVASPEARSPISIAPRESMAKVLKIRKGAA